MKYENVALKRLSYRDFGPAIDGEGVETFRDYILHRERNIIRIGSLNVLDHMDFQEKGSDGFSLEVEGERFSGTLDESIREFIVAKSSFSEEGALLNLAHSIQAKESFESRKSRPTIVAVAFNNDDEVLLVQNATHDNWSLPQGGMIGSEVKLEDPIVAMKRELKEELNITGGFSVVPTASVVRREIPFDRSTKLDELQDGNSLEWGWKQYHFYFVLLDNSVELKPDGLEVQNAGFYCIDNDLVQSMSDYKVGIVNEIFESMIHFKSNVSSIS